MKPRNKKPKLLHDSSGRARHPLVVMREDYTAAQIAKLLGHNNHSTVSIYVTRARKAPTTPIPAEWVPPLCRATGIAPATLRPDLYEPSWLFTRKG